MENQLWRAHMLLTLHRPHDAERIVRDVLATDPGDVMAHCLLSAVLLETRDVRGAIEEARKAVALDPESDAPLYALARALFDDGQLPAAESAVQAAIRIAPDEAAYATLLSAIELGRNRPRSALRTIARGRSLAPESTALAINNALALDALRRPGRAQQAVGEALTLNPNDAMAYETLGFLEASRDRPAAATTAFREALRLDPGSATARRGLLLALKLQNPLYRLARGRFSRFALAGIFLLTALLVRIPATNAIAPVVFVILLAWFGFADALITLQLRFDPAARRALDRREIVDSNRFAAAAGLALSATAIVVAGGQSYFLVALNFGFALFFIWAATDRLGPTRGFLLAVAGVLYALTPALFLTVAPSVPGWLQAIGVVAFLVWLLVLFFGVFGFLMYDLLVDLKASVVRLIDKFVDARTIFQPEAEPSDPPVAKKES